MRLAELTVCALIYIAPMSCFGQDGKARLVEFDSKAFGDPNLVMTVQEAERNERTSTIKVVRTKGTAVASSMFLVRAIYEIATARKSEYFISLRERDEEGSGTEYVVGFTNNKDADLKKEFGDQYDYEDENGETREYLRASDFDLVFKPKKSNKK